MKDYRYIAQLQNGVIAIVTGTIRYRIEIEKKSK